MSKGVVLCGCELVVVLRLCVVRRHATAFVIKKTKGVLRIGISLCCRKLGMAACLLVILWYIITSVVIEHTEAMLCDGIALFGCKMTTMC